MGTDLLESYRIPGEQTDLAGMAARCGQLGGDPGALFGVVQGLVLHECAFRRSGLPITPDQLADWDVSAGQVLEQALRLDPAPLSERRPPERRVAGQCFHSAVLYCALLRNRGLPARARCGFGSYLQPGAWVCHWVTERWDGGRWVCEDADAGRHDLGARAFRSAATAWLACRRDGDDPGRYGDRAGLGLARAPRQPALRRRRPRQGRAVYLRPVGAGPAAARARRGRGRLARPAGRTDPGGRADPAASRADQGKPRLHPGPGPRTRAARVAVVRPTSHQSAPAPARRLRSRRRANSGACTAHRLVQAFVGPG